MKMPRSEVLLSLASRSEASASNGVPLSETPMPRGMNLVLPRARTPRAWAERAKRTR
jgi:hypothetical protein